MSRRIDFHSHCDSTDLQAVEAFVAFYRARNTMAALSGGERYGGHDFAPNEFVLELARKYPDTIIPFARFDLWDRPDPDQVRRFADAGYKALKFIYPEYEYDHDLYMPVYEAAEECQLPCLFHTGLYRPSEGDIRWKRPVLKNMQPINLDRIARSFQKLNIVMAHMGTSMFREQGGELVNLHKNVYVDLAGCGNYCCVMPDELQKMLMPVWYARSTDVYRKLIFGADAYVTLPVIMEDAAKYYEALLLALPEEIQNGVFGGTVAKWLGIRIDG